MPFARPNFATLCVLLSIEATSNPRVHFPQDPGEHDGTFTRSGFLGLYVDSSVRVLVRNRGQPLLKFSVEHLRLCMPLRKVA